MFVDNTAGGELGKRFQEAEMELGLSLGTESGWWSLLGVH